MSWFHDLTGFHETTWEETRARLHAAEGRLTSRVNGRSWSIGVLETPSLDDLRTGVRGLETSHGGPRVRNLAADARALHAQAESGGALVQVASQFNLLEMTGPAVTPEQGVAIYQHDPTQGPACAIAAGPATIYRNYFADTGRGLGQTRERQLDMLRELAAALAPGAIPMRNGYALPSLATLRDVDAKLRASDPSELDRLRGLLRIGLHRDVEVTEPGPGRGQLLSQAFCSALPVAYGQGAPRDWEAFARLVLEAAYEATLLAAVANAARGGSNTVFLTMLGGGAFGNDRVWILDAIRRALHLVAGHPLDVCIVSYGRVPPELERLAEGFGGRGATASRPGATLGTQVGGPPGRERRGPLGAQRGGPPGTPPRAPTEGRQAFDHDGDAEPRPHGNCYWLARGRILAGEYPRNADAASSRAKLEALLDANVRRFVDLTEAREGLAPYDRMLAELASARGIEVVHVRHPIRDLDIPTAARMRGIVDAVLAPHDGVTYVHCWGGIGRTGTVAGCLLVEAGFGGQEAIELIARKWRVVDKYRRRPKSPETDAQLAFIRNWRPGEPASDVAEPGSARPQSPGATADLLVVFSHGKESGPLGAKIRALMGVAESEGALAISVDYREDPPGVRHDHDLPGEAQRRVRQLLGTTLPRARKLVLVGSSMGGFVSTVASRSLGPDGLFLLAPALDRPGYEIGPEPVRVPRIAVVHGWGDDVVPWTGSLRFAEAHRCALHLVDSDHRLDSALPVIEGLFRDFLRRVNEPGA